jgi:type II secretory pathway pseudopilin PulG
MQTNQKQFSLIERLVVVGIILIVSAISVQNVLHSVRTSEQRTLNKAAVEYQTVKGMYAEQDQTAPASLVGGIVAGKADSPNTPVH